MAENWEVRKGKEESQHRKVSPKGNWGLFLLGILESDIEHNSELSHVRASKLGAISTNSL